MIKIKQTKTIKVLCAMSGGVDSSVAAALLLEQGYEVLGVFLKFMQTYADKNCHADLRGYDGNTCCNDEALRSARSVCEKLKIPFYVFDISREFKKEVVDYYVSEYDSGRTPNPCVVCNKKIKFGWLLEKAKRLRCEFIATGHYARLGREFSNSNLQFSNKSQIKNSKSQTIKILKAKDKKKDQSYFLWQLSQEELRHIVFPIGDYKKERVWKMAQKWGLPTAQKPESQDVCFVPDGNNQKFLRKYAKKLIKHGDIVDTEGNILGRHCGLINYTIGQRHGLPQLKFSISPFDKLRAGNFQFPKDRPPVMFVIKLDVEKNQLVVGCEKDLYSKMLTAKNVNWIAGKPPKFSLTYQAKIRSTSKEVECKLSTINYQRSTQKKQLRVESCQLKVVCKSLQRAITPGQSVVIYNQDELLGGGIIK